MFRFIVTQSLRNSLLVMAAALVLVLLGIFSASRLPVNGEQSFLHQVLRFFRAPSAPNEVPLVVSPQMTAEPIEQRAMRGRVSAQAGQHPRLQLQLGALHFCSLVVRQNRPQGYSA